MATNFNLSAVSDNSIIGAADNHNIANGEESWLDKVSQVPEFAAVSAVSGLNSLVNSGKAIANIFGADLEETKTEDVIRGFDDNLADYYSSVQPYADVAGFVATSFIPGGLGVKLYKAGSKALWAAKGGQLGLATADATGLLAPFREKYLSSAIKELTDAPSLTRITNTSYLKAVAAGVGENALQTAAFESAVAATMFRSPTLDDMDVSDMASNAAWSVAFGGVLGGAIDAATGFNKIRKAVTAYDPLLNQFRMIKDVPESAPSWYKTRNYIQQHAQEFDETLVPEGLDPKVAQREFVSRKQKLELKVIDSIKPMTGNDVELANIIGHNLMSAKSTEDMDAALLKLSKIERVAEPASAGQELTSELAKTKLGSKAKGNLRQATAFVNSIDGSMDETILPRLGDTLMKGEKMTFLPDSVRAGGQTYSVTSDVVNETTTALQAEANWLHALNAPASKFEFSTLENATVDSVNLPKLERAYKYWDDMAVPTINVRKEDGDLFSMTNKADLRKYIDQQKFTLVEQLQNTGMDYREISQRLNVSRKFAEDPASALMSYTNDADIAKHLQYMENAGRVTDANFQTNPFTKPTSYRLVYDTPLGSFSKERIEAETYYRAIDKELNQQAVALLNKLETGSQFPELGVDKILQEANRTGAGSGTFTFANGEYLSLPGTMERIGKLTADEMIRKGGAVADEMQPVFQAVKKNKDATLEFNVLDTKIRSTPNKFMYDPDAKMMFDWKLERAVDAMRKQGGAVDYEYLAAVAKGDKYDPELSALIDFNTRADKAGDWIMPVKSQEVGDAIQAHITSNDRLLADKYAIAKQRGIPMADFRGTFYAPPIDVERYPHFAIVRDASYGGGGSVGYLTAPNAETLEQMIARVPAEDGFQVLRKSDIKNFKTSLGEYKYDMSINENRVNSMLYRKGLLKPYAPATDSSRALDDYLTHHISSAEQGVREIVDNRYSAEFRTLRNMAEEQKSAEASVWGSMVGKFTNATNPYEDYVKTALNVSRKSEFPLSTISTFIEDKVDSVWNKMKQASAKAKSADELEHLNAVMKENGLGEPYTDPMMEIFANSTVDRGVLRKAVGKINNVMSSVMLGLDSINAVNNMVGSAVLQSSEIKYIMGLAKSDAKLAAAVDNMIKVKVPGQEIWTMAPAKIQAAAIKAFWNDKGELLDRYKNFGFLQDELYQMKSMVMDASVNGTESIATLGKKADALFDKGRKLTGNRKAEEYTRFTSAYIMDKLTEPLIAAGSITEKEAQTMMQTFVNRVNGNYLASQRPMITQGALGQATTLFLTYQANLMQQLFKYVANGDKRAAMTMMGTQSLLYGMNGLPGFDMVNNKIAMMAGNRDHRDAHSFIQGIVGDEAYEWLMYGLGSNALGVISPDLKFNLYSRGDINPRNPTIIPTDPMQIPSVSITAKAVGAIKDTFDKIDNGGNAWNSALQGIEHLGINRPLSGLAAALNGRTTTNATGATVAGVDWNELGTYIRIAGAKPLNEAITLDWYYRNKVITAHEADMRTNLGAAVKTAFQNGNAPSPDQMNTFMTEYTKAGGDIKGFNRFMINNMKGANASIFANTKDMLRSNFGVYLQHKMGGALYADYADAGYAEPEPNANEPQINQEQPA